MARIAILVFFLLVVFALYRSGAFAFFMDRERVRTFLESLGPLSFIGFILLQTLQVVAAPVPGEVTGLLGGFLYGTFLGLLLSTIGLTIGSFVNFWLSKTFGRPFVDRFVKKETVERYDYLLHHKGAFLVFLLFLIPGTPKDLLCYILGLGHLTLREFLLISTVGRFGGTLLLTLGGSFIRHHQYYRFSALLAVAIVIVFLSMVYKDKMERLFRLWHISERKKARRKQQQ
ncbi:MAG: TVP38/TMEM64 family protein [Thermodesulfovibrionales bacterium]